MPLTVATWNVQNFAVAIGGASAFVQKLDSIVSTLVATDADVIALQEILDGDVAVRMAAALNRRVVSDKRMYTAINGQADRRHNRVAFLSRLPIVAAETESLTAWRSPTGSTVMRLERVAGKIVAVTEATLPRPPLRIRVTLSDGSTIDLINVHLKSRRLRFPGGGFSTEDASLRAEATRLAFERRAAEAMSVRARVDDLLAAGERVVVLGDFNDGPDAATAELLYGRDDNEGRRLFNLTELIPAERRWSRKGDAQAEMIDHILVSRGLTPRHGSVDAAPSVHVLNGDVLSSGITDHALVYATFSQIH